MGIYNSYLSNKTIDDILKVKIFVSLRYKFNLWMTNLVKHFLFLFKNNLFLKCNKIINEESYLDF
jgi:hypothetical protein